MLPSNIGHFITALVALFRAVGWRLLLNSITKHLFSLQPFLCDVCIVHQCIVSLCGHQTMTNGNPSLTAAWRKSSSTLTAKPRPQSVT